MAGKDLANRAWLTVFGGSGILPRAVIPEFVRRRRWLVWTLGLVLAGFTHGMFSAAYYPMVFVGPSGFGITLALVQTLPMLIAFRAPLLAWRLSFAGMVGAILLVPLDWQWPWSPGASIVYAAISILVAIAYDRRITVTVGLLGVSGIILPGAILHTIDPVFMLLGVAMLIIPLTFGDLIRASRTAERKLVESEEGRRAEATLRAVLEERARIARELHDVVAHHMSVIAVQAEAAPYRIPELPEQARNTFHTIRTAAKESLAETRRVVGLLRDEDERAARDPVPDLDKIEELVEGSREMGMYVNLTVRGDPVQLPAGVGMSMYRIAQESLSNARRHAPGAKVEVALAYAAESVELRIANGPGRPVDTPEDREPGHGLLGMRERVAVLGGTLEAGPVDDGGFLVRAAIPHGSPHPPPS